MNKKISDLENVSDFDEMITPSDELINAFQFMLKDIGEDKNRDGLKNTPRRAAAAFKFLNHGYKLNVDKIVNNALFDSDLEDMVEFMNSNVATEVKELIYQLDEYIKGGRDSEHEQLREAYGNIPIPRARKIRSYMFRILEDAYRYERERRPGRKKA